MRPTTTTALALAGTALALPAGVALADTNDDPPSPTESALAAPFAGHLTMNAQMRAERREVLVERLTPQRHPHRAQDRARQGRGVLERRAHERRLRGDSPAELRDELAQEPPRAAPRQARRRRARDRPGRRRAAPLPPHLEAIAACESGGNPTRRTPATGSTAKYQFTQETWAVVGGTGNPAAALRAEQDARAAQLYAQSGSSPWPVCGQYDERVVGRSSGWRGWTPPPSAAEFPVLERIAYLNAGRTGRWPRRRCGSRRPSSRPSSTEGRATPHFERRFELQGAAARGLCARDGRAPSRTSR